MEKRKKKNKQPIKNMTITSKQRWEGKYPALF